jgi:hypothetical protein
VRKFSFEEFFYRLRNSRSYVDAVAQDAIAGLGGCVGLLTMHGELRATLIRGDGSRVTSLTPRRRFNLGLLSRRVVTDAGVNFMVDAFQNTAEIENFNFHDAGTGVAAEAVGNTTLGTPWGGARATGTQSEPAANQYRSVGTITFNAAFAITEHGLFSASSSGTLWDRSVFSAINVVNTDSIQFTYTLTVNSGG